MKYVERFCTKKWLTGHIEREDQPKIDNINKKNFLPEKQKQDNNPSVSTYEMHAYVVIGPRNDGKTYYMLKILEKMAIKNLFI